MTWHDERERLLADTIAFVQQATGESLALAVKLKAPLSPEIVAAAKYLRTYHQRPKPVQIDALRHELRCAADALNNMQPSLYRGHVSLAGGAACKEDGRERVILQAA